MGHVFTGHQRDGKIIVTASLVALAATQILQMLRLTPGPVLVTACHTTALQRGLHHECVCILLELWYAI